MSDAELASRFLASVGVPGIKYLDQSSRALGDGTHNYVIFDDSLVSIEAKFARTKDPFLRSVTAAGLPVDKVQSIVDRVASKWRNRPVIHVIGSMEESPREMRDLDAAMRAGGATGKPRAFIHSNEVWLVADALNSEAMVYRALFHESLGHWGLRKTLGERMEKVLAEVARSMPGRVKQKARDYGLDTANDEDLLNAAEEVLAELAETRPEMGIVRRAIAAIRQFMRDLGININLSNDDIITNFILPARRFVEEGVGAGSATAASPVFARAPSTESEAFKRWFGESKVVDENGDPLVVYHGTADDITQFDLEHPNRKDTGWLGTGVYVTTSPEIASSYAVMKGGGEAPNVMPLYARIENPYYATQADKDGFMLVAAGKGGKAAARALADKWTNELKAKGHDGVILEYKAEQVGKGLVSKEMVIFDPAGVKSAFNERPTTSSKNIMFSRGRSQRAAVATQGQMPSRASWNVDEPGKLDAFIRVLQDKHIDAKRVVQAIKNAAGVLADAVDVYLKEELFHGRAAKGVHEFLDQELRPLFTDMVARGVAMRDFEEYLHARHAEERNIQIAKVNPNMPDGGSGMDTQDARDYLAGLDPVKKRAYEALAKRVDAITAKTRQELISYGLESPSAIAAWEATYQNYVPLMREDLEGGLGTGQGFSVRGGQKRALGSKRAVVDILANLAQQRERAIVRGEKNRVSNALVGLAKANPNPDFWKVDQPPKIRYIDDATGLVAERPDPMFKSLENVVVARTPDANGEIVEHAVIFNEHDERAMRMALALKNLDANDLGEVLGLSAKITRYFASINTQYNPVFGVVNLIRDTQGALFNLTTTPIRGHQLAVLQHTISALRGIYIDTRDARLGKHPTSAWATLWEEFQTAGGQTGYRDMFRTSKDRAEAIEREFKRVAEGKAKGFGRGVFDWLSDYNTAMENAVRLAAYKVGKENGMTSERAASMAKNLTVNFNRRGQIGTQAGALYAFFNASVQGTARLAETLKGPQGKKIIAGGVILGAMQALLLAAAGFDDDEPPDFVRERNLVIPIGGKKYITIPMPLGLHILPNLGRIPTEFVLSGFKDPGKRIMQLVNAFAEAFNPVGNAGLSLQTIAPTLIDPVAALAENKDWTGKPIAREDFSKLAPTPGHARAKDTASEFSKAVSKALNWLTGGTTYQPGIFSPTPDQIDYLIGQVTGGLGREAMKVEQTVTSAITGEELPTYKIPLFGRFYGSSEGQAPQASAFYDNLRAINMHEAEVKGRRRSGEPIGDYFKQHPEAQLIHHANRVERQVSTLRRERRLLIEKKAPREKIKAVDDRITNIMRSFNERVRRATEKEAA